MVDSKEQALKKVGEDFVRMIKQQFDDKGLNYTGKAKDSISYKVENTNKLIIEGIARTLFLEFGRRPGTPPPFNVIKEWVIKKLAPPENAVWIITKTIVDKIAAKGTRILTNKSLGLNIDIVLEELNNELQKLIINFEAERITAGLITTWKT